MRQALRTLALTLTVLTVSTAAFASTILQFNEVLPFNTPFTLTENGTNTGTTLIGTKLVTASFDSAFCLTVACGGAVNGGQYTLTVNANSIGAASVVGTAVSQPWAGTISITNGAINLLTVNFTDLFSGSLGGTNPTLEASQPPDLFSGTSTVFDPAKLGTPRGFAFSLSNLSNGGLGVVGTSVRSGVADLTGTFNATAPAAVPEPASMVLLGSGLMFVARRVRKARQ